MPRGRIIYGAATATLAAALVFVQPTEFGIKVAILSSLTLTCALVPLIDSASGRLRRGPDGDLAAAKSVKPPSLSRRLRAGALTPATIAVIIIALTAVVGTAALAGDKDLTYIERGLTGKRTAQ